VVARLTSLGMYLYREVQVMTRKQIDEQVSVELLNKSEVAKFFRVSDRTLSRWQRDPNFPKAIRVTSSSRPRWVVAELHAYIDAKSAEVNEIATLRQSSYRQHTTRQQELPDKPSLPMDWSDLKRKRALKKSQIQKGGDR
jgi:predicted DNA-binding transcriptional regulator AlpA